jgi:hypothetical protein
MTLLKDAHFIIAFLVALCALVFSWNSMGRRVMNAVTGLQFLVGLILAGVLGAQHIPLSPLTMVHLLCALGLVIIYVLAKRLGDRPGGERIGLILGALGVILVFVTIALGLRSVVV